MFIVPAAQGEEDLAAAREAGGDDLEIITVATLDEALEALERLGGDPLVPIDADSVEGAATTGEPTDDG